VDAGGYEQDAGEADAGVGGTVTGSDVITDAVLVEMGKVWGWRCHRMSSTFSSSLYFY